MQHSLTPLCRAPHVSSGDAQCWPVPFLNWRDWYWKEGELLEDTVPSLRKRGQSCAENQTPGLLNFGSELWGLVAHKEAQGLSGA